VNTTKKRWYRSKAFNLTIGVCFTFLSVWWAFQSMRHGPDGVIKSYSQVFGEIGSAFKNADYRSLPVIWAATALFYVIKAWRWKMLLEPIGRFKTLTDLLPAIMIGFAFNNVLPAHLGEFIRMFVFSKEHKVSKTGVFSSIALERIFDVIAILSFLAVGLLLVDSSQIDRTVVVSAWVFAGGVCVGLAGAAVYLTWTAPVVAMIERTIGWLPFVPESLKQKIAGMLEAGADGLASLRSIRLLTGILFTSYVQWAFNGLMIFLSLWAFGIPVSPLVAGIVLGVVAVGVTVPSTPGYFGVIQLCFVLVLKLFVDESQMEAVFAASIYYHMAQWLPVTAIGMLYFLRAGFRLSDIQGTADQKESDPNGTAGLVARV
jgi:uncharacterized protein (TIRG00374 family)